MTSDRDLKRVVRARAAKTGESYQTARRHVTAAQRVTSTLSPQDVAAVQGYFDGFARLLEQWRVRGGPWPGYDAPVPVAAMQTAALAHPNAKTRRACLNVLDHYANDESVEVFRAALRDPVPRVRIIALHGLSCERCRREELCVADVAPDLLEVLRGDPSAKVRHAVLAPLALLADRDDTIPAALATAARTDPDAMVRDICQRVLSDGPRGFKSRKSLRRRARSRDA